MRRITALLGLVVLLVIGTSAQEPARPAQSPPPAPPPEAQAGQPAPATDAAGQPVFRTGINFVRVDVIATDKQGMPVTDLSLNDFEVFEDGKPQAVETFRLIKVDAVAPEDTTRAIRTREDEETAAADENARIFVFFLDDYNVRQSTAMAVRKPVSDFIRTQLAPNDLVAVMYPLTPLDGVVLTRNHEGVIRAVERFEGRKFRYEPRNEIEMKYSDQPTEIVERIRRQVSLSALKGLSVKLGALREGRKAIVLLSEGYTAMLPPQMRDAIAGCPGSATPRAATRWRARTTSTRTVPAAWRRSTCSLNCSWCSTPPIDRTRRSTRSIPAACPPASSTSPTTSATARARRRCARRFRRCRRSPRTPTAAPSSIATTWRRGWSRSFATRARITCSATTRRRRAQDGKFHPIRVRMKRSGVQVRARKGYWALSAADASRVTAAAEGRSAARGGQGDLVHCLGGRQSSLRQDLARHRPG